MEANKTKMKEFKQWLKDEAIRLRELKSEIKTEARAGHIGKAGSLQYELSEAKYFYRHKHIAYSMAKGKTYAQIESSVRYGNEPSMRLVRNYLDDLCECEATA